MVLHDRFGLLVIFMLVTTRTSQLPTSMADVDTDPAVDVVSVADVSRYIRDKRTANPIGNAVLRGMRAVVTLTYKAKKLPYPHSRRFITKYEKPGGVERLQEDFRKVRYDETRDFYMKNGNWGVMGRVGDRVVIAMIGGNGEKLTLRIVKAADLQGRLKNENAMLPREEIIYTTGNPGKTV